MVTVALKVGDPVHVNYSSVGLTYTGIIVRITLLANCYSVAIRCLCVAPCRWRYDGVRHLLAGAIATAVNTGVEHDVQAVEIDTGYLTNIKPLTPMESMAWDLADDQTTKRLKDHALRPIGTAGHDV